MSPRIQRHRIGTIVQQGPPQEVMEETARTAAGAAVDAEIEGRNLVEGGAIVEPEIAFAVVDEDGRRTWIEAGLDGKPTTRASQLIAEAAGPAIASAVGIEDQETAITGLSIAIVDEDDRRTWLEADDAGRPTDRSLALLRAGLEEGAATAGTYRDNTGREWPVSSGPDIVCWGDSMTAAGWPATLASLTGRVCKNAGVGGDSALDILARQGGEPHRIRPVGGVIPASGPVDVVFTYRIRWPFLQGATSWVGTWAGVRGTLAIARSPEGVQYQHHEDDRYYFTRAEAGDEVPITRDAPFKLDLAENARGDIAVFWSGRNNAYVNDPEGIVGSVQRGIQYLSPLDKRYLVLSVGIGEGEVVGHFKRDNIDATNSRYRNFFGNRYIDINAYMVEYGLADAGITPTAQDIEDQANGIIPASLRADAVHLNSAGNQIVAEQVAQRLREMEWI